MKASFKVTADGLISALRQHLHALAEEIEDRPASREGRMPAAAPPAPANSEGDAR